MILDEVLEDRSFIQEAAKDQYVVHVVKGTEKVSEAVFHSSPL